MSCTGRSPAHVGQRAGGLRYSHLHSEVCSQIEQVNEAICDARPPLAAPGEAAPGTRGKKGQLSRELAAALASEAAAEVTRLAAAAAQSVAAGQGLEAAEQVIRAGLLRLGAGMLEDLLAIDAGYAGPRIGWTTRPLAASRRLNPRTPASAARRAGAWTRSLARAKPASGALPATTPATLT